MLSMFSGNISSNYWKAAVTSVILIAKNKIEHYLLGHLSMNS